MHSMQRVVADTRHAGMEAGTTVAACSSPDSIAFFNQQSVDSEG
jgi:hypothetical protein